MGDELGNDDELYDRRPALNAEGQQLGQRPICQEVVLAKNLSVAGVGALLLHSASAGETAAGAPERWPQGAWPPSVAADACHLVAGWCGWLAWQG